MPPMPLYLQVEQMLFMEFKKLEVTLHLLLQIIKLAGITTEKGFTGISNSATDTSTGIATVNGNTVGSPSVANSIKVGTPTTIGITYGINANQAALSYFNDNTIANITSYYEGNTTSGPLRAIYLSGAGPGSITGNTIFNLKNASTVVTTGNTASIVGIANNSTRANQTISKNMVYALENTSGDANAAVVGIYAGGGSGTYSNNIVNLGMDASGADITAGTSMAGIYNGGGANSYYFNTLNISGAGVSGTTSSTYALYGASTVGNLRNNILTNTRDGGTGGMHYSARLSTAPTTLDYNDYYVAGGTNFLATLGTTDYTDLALWQAATSFKDANSLNVDPAYTSASNLSPTNGALVAGTSIAGITTDYAGTTRAATPTIGALEANACSNPTAGGTIEADQAGCDPFDPALITSAAAASGFSGTLEYKWQLSTTGNSTGFSDIASSNSESYDPGSLTQTTWYKRLARVDCKSDWTNAASSNVVEMTVNPVPEVTTANTATICSGTSPAIALEATETSNFSWTVGTITGSITGATDGSGTLIDETLTNGGTTAGTVEYIVTPTSVAGNCVGPDYTITVTVDPVVPVSVQIFATQNPACSGNPVQFFATPSANTSGAALTYQWKVNGDPVGSNMNNYTYQPTNGDVVTCELSTDIVCPNVDPAVSNAITMQVSATLTPLVSVTTSTSTTICEGESVTYTAHPTNGGSVPSYEWIKNNTSVATGATYTYTPADGDEVYVIMTSNSTCVTSSTATSDPVVMTVNPVLAASVTIAADANDVCAGTEVTFTPTPVNGGTLPSYEWFVTPAGGSVTPSGTGSTFTYAPADGDAVYAIMTSNATPCLAGSPANSNTVVMTVNPAVLVVITNPSAVVAPATVDLTNPEITVGSTTGLTFTYWTDAAATIPYVSYSNATTGTFYIKGTASNGCYDIQPVTVQIEIGNNTVDFINGQHATICATVAQYSNAILSAPAGAVFTKVDFASYGNPTGTCPDFVLGSCNAVNSQSIVEGYLLGNNSASIPANYGTFGDPCPGTAKKLYVSASYTEPICAGNLPGTITGSTPAGGTGAFTYLWQSSTTSATIGFSAAAGTNNSQDYVPGALAQTTWFKRTVTSGAFTSTSKVIMIKVNPLPTVVTVNQTVSLPETVDLTLPAVTAGSSAGLTFTYWTDALASITYATPTAATPGMYYIKGTDATGCYDIQPVTITANTQIGNNTVDFINGQHATICATVAQYSNAILSAPAGAVFTKVDFASYGNPTGTCPDFVLGSCNAVNSQSIVEGYLLGNNSASIPANYGTFGDPCPGTAKKLYVSASYTEPICAGNLPGTITGSTPAGGTGAFTYLWQSSTTSATTGFSAAAGTNNSQDYVPGALAQTTWFKRTVTSGAFTSTSKVIMIKVNPLPTVVTVNQTVSLPETVDLTLPAVTAGSSAGLTFTYWTDALASITYATPTAATPGMYYIKGTDATGCYDIQPVTITANTQIVNNTVDFINGQHATICATVAQYSNAILSAPAGAVFTKVDFASYGNPTGTCPDFVLGSCNAVNSQSIVEGYLLGNNSASIPANYGTFGDPCPGTAKKLYVSASYTEPICAGNLPGTITGSTPAGGTGAFTYLWQSSTTSATIGFSAAAGTNNSQDYVPGALAQTTWFKRTVTSGAFTSTSKVIMIKVNPLPTVVTVNQTVSLPETVDLTLPAVTAGSSAGLTFTYWTDALASITYATPTAATPGMYYIKGTDATGCYDIQPVTITANTQIVNNTVDFINGQHATICATVAQYSNAILSAPAGAVFTKVDFASYGNPTGTCPDFVLGSCNAVNSQSIVEGYLLGNNSASIPANYGTFGDPCPGTAKKLYVSASYTEPICAGNLPGTITGSTPAGGTGAFTYLWQSSTTSATIGFSAAAGTNNSQDYVPGALAQTTWFKRTVTSGAFTSTSKVIMIKVNPLPTVVTVNQTVSLPETVDLTLPAVTAGSSAGLTFTYWTDALASITYATPTAATPGMYYIKGTDATGCYDIQPVTITANTQIVNNTVDFINGQHATICATVAQYSNAILSAPAGAVFTKVDFASYGNPTGTCPDFVLGSCNAVNSQSIVEGYLLGNNSASIPANYGTFGDPCPGTAKKLYVSASYTEPICAGNLPGTITGSTPAGGTGAFTYLWQSSTTSATIGFSAAAGTNNSQDYVPGALAQTTWFKRTVTSGAFTSTSVVLQITVVDCPAAPEVAATESKSAEIATSTFDTPQMELGDLKVYPNPFSDRLRFEFVATQDVNARIDMYDMSGRMVKTMFEQPVMSGASYEAEFKPETTVSGMYMYRLVMGDAVFNGKVVFRK